MTIKINNVVVFLLFFFFFEGGGGGGASILHSPPLSLNQYYTVLDFIGILSICSPHRSTTTDTQRESDNPASERQPVTQLAETDQTRYKVVTIVIFTALLTMACPNRVVLHI